MVNPVKLEYLMESQIVAFAYRAEERRFTIISSYPERSPGSVYDLVGLVFQDVNRFHREAGDVPQWSRTTPFGSSLTPSPHHCTATRQPCIRRSFHG